MIDWTNPIRWKEDPKRKLHFVGFDSIGHAVIDSGAYDLYGAHISIRKKDGTGFDEEDLTVENIPERVERWVVGYPNNICAVWWFKTEEEALTHSKLGYSKPIRIEVEMP